MTKFKLPAISILGLLSSGITIADDAPAYLRAINKRDTSACYNVVDADKRTLCIAEIKAERSLCYSIINTSTRDECMARAQREK